MIACVNQAFSKSYHTAPSCGLFQKHVKVRVKTFCRVEVGVVMVERAAPLLHTQLLVSQLLAVQQSTYRCVAGQDRLFWLLMIIQYFGEQCQRLFEQTLLQSKASLIIHAALSAAILGFNFNNIIQIRKHGCLRVQANSSFKENTLLYKIAHNSHFTHIYWSTLLLPATLCRGLLNSGLKFCPVAQLLPWKKTPNN